MKTIPFAVLSSFVLAALVPAARAGDHIYGPYPANYVQECGDCHLPYPPQLLGSEGWKQMIGRLDRHFGTDASLEAKARDEIAAFLFRQASGRDKHRPVGAEARITTTAWFRHEHGNLPVKSSLGRPAAAQCETCHQGAAKGRFAEGEIKLPAGYRHREGDRS